MRKTNWMRFKELLLKEYGSSEYYVSSNEHTFPDGHTEIRPNEISLILWYWFEQGRKYERARLARKA